MKTKFDVKFKEHATFDVKFDSVNNISDGGYERGYEQGYREGIEAGYDAGAEDNCDLYVRYARTIQFGNLNLFGKSHLILTLDNATSLAGIFNQDVKNTTVEHITIHSKSTAISNIATMFYTTVHTGFDYKLRHITLNFSTANAKHMTTVFMGLPALEIIDGQPIDASTTTNLQNFAAKCEKLTEVRFAQGTIFVSISFKDSALLSAESIQSIIDGLADLTGQTAQTLILHATVKAKLTEEQIAAITSKNWTLA